MNTDSPCISCGGTMARRSSWVSECQGCGFLVSGLTAGSGTDVGGLETLRRRNFEVILGRLEAALDLAGARVLEVGSAGGWFLEAAEARGARAHGIEPERANAMLSEQRGLDVECGFFPEDLRDPGPFDLIVFNDVFEHLPAPVRALTRVEELLVEGGLVVLNLPSSRGVLFRVADLLARLGVRGPYERLWQKGFDSPHVSYFAPRNLTSLVRRHTGLNAAGRFPLRAVSRHGLRERITNSHRGPSELGMLAGVWLLSLILPWLPSDIEVLVFRKGASR